MKSWLLLTLPLALLLGRGATGAHADVRGYWLNEQADAVIEIATCEQSLCGRIVWLRQPTDALGRRALDSRNPVPALRSRPLLGLTILTGFDEPSHRAADRASGRIYDPENGRTYTCKLRAEGRDHLHIRGYIGIPLIGRTTTWTRVAARDVERWALDPASAPFPEGAKCDRR